MQGKLNSQRTDDSTDLFQTENADALDSQAARCRRLAAAIGDRETAELLNRMAEGLERNAAALRRFQI